MAEREHRMVALCREAGFCLIPCKPHAKEAALPWTEYQTRKPTEDELAAWFNSGKGYNLAVVTGEISGVLVLDVDGAEAMELLKGKELPLTPMVRTARGWHYYYRWPGYAVRCLHQPLPGLDVKGDGGYVLAPDSVHPSGVAYEWIASPEELPLADAPRWLLELAATPRPVAAPAARQGGVIPRGKRNSTLASLAGVMRRIGVDEGAIMAALFVENRRCCKPPLPDKEVEAIARSIARYDPASSPLVQDAPCSSWQDLSAILGPIRWHWKRWLAAGFLHLLAGESGKGKSALALALASCYLTGRDWPDQTPFTGERGSILWIEGEGAQALNLERAKLWGLPLGRILTPFPTALHDVSLDEQAQREVIEMKAMHDEVKLIIVDSLSGCAGGRDENSTDMLELVKWLALLARDAQKPVLLTHHLRKRGLLDSDGVSLDRLRGHSSIVQTARLVWMLDAPDPNQPEVLRLAVAKSNLDKWPSPCGLRIDAQGVHYCAVPQASQPPTSGEKAVAFLKEALQYGPLKSSDLNQMAQEEGISERTLQRARRALGVLSVKQDEGWYVTLPP